MNPIQILKDNIALVILIAVLAVAYFFLRNRASDIGSPEEFDSIVSGGQPAVVEFFSNT